MLYNENFGCMLIGCLLKQPQLLLQPQYPLSKKDFSPNNFHKVMYIAIKKLVGMGCQEITPIELDNILQTHAPSYEIANDNDYMSFVETTKDLANVENYEAYYNSIRKFSLLRELKEQGFDIKDFYDELEDETKELAKLEKLSIQDILNNVEFKTIELRNAYDINFVRAEMIAGEDTEELVAEFEEAPTFGAFRSSPYLTQLFLGLNRGHLQMHSAPSGVGKTRMSIMDLCYLSSKVIWNDEKNDFVENLNYTGPGLFIATEMNLRKEINPSFLACISGVSSFNITQGKLTPDEKERVYEAGRALSDTSQIVLTDMPDFTSSAIDRKIKEKVEGLGVENVVFDYLQLNGSLAEEYKTRNGGVPSREDLVLRSLATDLKAYAEKYDVRMITSSQLNGNEKNMEFPDESCLSSAKSIKQKLDGGVIYLPSVDRKKEMKILEPFINRKGFGNEREPLPNTIGYVYKSRFGLYSDQKVKILSYFDKGRLRIKDYMVADIYNQPISIPRPILSKMEDD